MPEASRAKESWNVTWPTSHRTRKPDIYRSEADQFPKWPTLGNTFTVETHPTSRHTTFRQCYMVFFRCVLFRCVLVTWLHAPSIRASSQLLPLGGRDRKNLSDRHCDEARCQQGLADLNNSTSTDPEAGNVGDLASSDFLHKQLACQRNRLSLFALRMRSEREVLPFASRKTRYTHWFSGARMVNENTNGNPSPGSTAVRWRAR